MNLRLLISLTIVSLYGSIMAAERYEAENAVVDENSVQKVADSKASGGFYIGMKEGKLSFKVTATTSGFYTLWASYSQPSDPNGKIQNLSVNGSSTGQISFPCVDTFKLLKASSKIKLTAGSNTIEITKSWGWVNIDYIELTSYEGKPFSVTGSLVTPNASVNAKKIYAFLKNNFQKKIISGVMTDEVMLTDGKYTPNTMETQKEVAYIISASGKTPALLGLDFMHATGKSSEGEWHHGYTKATVSLAEDVFKKGGIPIFCYHWKDPNGDVETFYSKSSGNSPYTEFDLFKAFVDSNTCEAFNTSSNEYNAILKNMDTVAGYIKILADKGIPILWRPLHEASGKWFWWGYKGPKACKALYKLMFDRFTSYHKLNNLIWVWTTDEAGDALDWYPGDDYVDIIGRDYYYYPREANHGSLVASFEKLKDIYGVNKLITLSENGSVPHPDSLAGDGAGWSWFMPWNRDYTMDGWAHDNTADDWKSIMNNDYVITLDKMPGWDNYDPTLVKSSHRVFQSNTSISFERSTLNLSLGSAARTIGIYNLNGTHMSTLNQSTVVSGNHQFKINGLAKGVYLVKITYTNASENTVKPIVIK